MGTATISKQEVIRRLQIAQDLLKLYGQTSSLDATGLTPMTAVSLAVVTPTNKRNAIAKELSKSYDGDKGEDFISPASQRYLQSLGMARVTCRLETDEALVRLLGRSYRKSGLPSADPDIVAKTIAKLEKSRKS